MGDNSSPRRWSHQGSDFNCCRECHNALATILDLMEVEKSEAADREKRLVSRIDLQARTVKDLSGSVVTQSTISTPTYSDTGNVNMSSAEGNSLAEVQKLRRERRRKREKYPPAGSRVQLTLYGTTVWRASATVKPFSPARCTVRTSCSGRYNIAKSCTASYQEAGQSIDYASQHFPAPSFEESLDDDSWKTISSKRPEPKKKVLFVGNLRSDVMEDGLKTFIAQRLSTSSLSMTVAISQCSLFKKEQSTSARIVVNARDASILLDERFWPRPVYTRSWNFEKYSSKDKADSDTETDESPVRRLRAVSAQISATEKQNDEEENARRTTDVLHDALASSMPNASPPPESEVITRSQSQHFLDTSSQSDVTVQSMVEV